MKRRTTIFTLLILVFLSTCFSFVFSAEKKIVLNEGWFMKSSSLVGLDGEHISSQSFKSTNWYSTSIPTTVLSALVKNGIYPDPYVGLNNMQIPDASEVFSRKYDLGKFSHLPGKRNPWIDPYWFRTQFRLPSEYEGKFIWLHLDGINYRAEVWLNGHHICGPDTVTGMFGNWSLDLTAAANPGAINTLALKIYPLDYPGLPGEPQLKALGTFGLNGGETGDIGKNVTMQSAVGWDWIPAVRDRNMGIWQDVAVSTTGPVDLRNSYVISDLPLPRTDEAELRISTELVNLSPSPQEGLLIARICAQNSQADAIILQKRIRLESQQSVVVRFDSGSHSSLLIKNPNLWWPNGMGEQNLYSIDVRFVQGDEESDRECKTFGIREVTSEVSMLDKWARRDFYINGKKVLIKGGAWVPDMMLNRSPEKLRNELCLSQKANLNMVRIWGGGVTPPESFFSICDELGLMVWHDFWITGDCQGTWGKGSQDYPLEGGVFLQNAADVVRKLRNHPSIVVWTAGNEGYPRKEIYLPLRNDIVAKLDGTRPFIPSSGYRLPPKEWGLSWPDNKEAGTYSGGPYWWVEPREYYQKVDLGKDWLFKNEVGMPSLPTLESVYKFLTDLTPDPGVKFPLNHVWGYHDACEGNGKFSLYDNALRRRYGEPESLADYLLKGQLVNAENYRAIFEAVNHAMHKVAGVLLWKTNPAWPSVVWQLYDWYLSPHAGYFFVKKACEPLHIQLNIDDYSVSVINQTLQTHRDLTVAVNVYSIEMEKILSRNGVMDIPSGSAKDIFDIEISREFLNQVHFVELRLLDKEGSLLSENFYWLSEKKDFTSLTRLPEVQLDIKILSYLKNPSHKVKFLITNPSPWLAFFINPRIHKGVEGGEALPSFWSDNYFSLMPGRSIELEVEFLSAELAGKDAYLKIGGWNIIPQAIKIK